MFVARPTNIRILCINTLLASAILVPGLMPTKAYADHRWGLDIGFGGGPTLIRVEIECALCHYSQKYDKYANNEEKVKHEKQILPEHQYALREGEKLVLDDNSFLMRDMTEKNRMVLFGPNGKKRIIFPKESTILKNLANKPAVIYVPN